MVGIYKITAPDGRVYIGKSINIAGRWQKHREDTNGRLNESMLRYGHENHSFDIIHECEEWELRKMEGFFIRLYNSSDVKVGLNSKQEDIQKIASPFDLRFNSTHFISYTVDEMDAFKVIRIAISRYFERQSGIIKIDSEYDKYVIITVARVNYDFLITSCSFIGKSNLAVLSCIDRLCKLYGLEYLPCPHKAIIPEGRFYPIDYCRYLINATTDYYNSSNFIVPSRTNIF